MDVKMPDGTIIKNVPDHYSQEDLLEQYGRMSKGEEKPKVNVDDFPRYKEEAGHRFAPTSGASTAILSGLAGAQGVLKPIAGALQFLGINKPMEALEANAQYAKSSVPTTMGINPASAAETVGEIAPTLAIPADIGANIPMVANAISKSPSLKYVAPSFVQGLGGQVTDTANKSYLDILGEKIADLGVSTGLGVLGGKVGQMVTDPQVSARLQQLKDMGMTKFTPGQLASQFPMIGEGLQKLEKGLTSLPIAGSMVSQGIKSSYEDFNKAIGNKILSNLGLKLDKDAPVGNKMVDAIKQKIGDAYDDFLQKATFSDAYNHLINKDTSQHLSDVADRAMAVLVPAQQKMMANDIATNVSGHIQNEKYMTGTQYREVEKYLGNKATEFYKMGMDGLGNAYSEVQRALREELKYQNPQMAKGLEQAHKAFREFQPLEVAASRRGAEEGVFTPDQFKSAVQQVAGKSATATGKGVMVPESQAASDVLGATLPSSGTAERLSAMMLAKGAAEGLGHLKTGFVPLATTALLYNTPMMKAMTKVATERPQVIRNLKPAVSGALSRLGANYGALPDNQ